MCVCIVLYLFTTFVVVVLGGGGGSGGDAGTLLVLEVMPVKLPISVANVKTSPFIIQILI